MICRLFRPQVVNPYPFPVVTTTAVHHSAMARTSFAHRHVISNLQDPVVVNPLVKQNIPTKVHLDSSRSLLSYRHGSSKRLAWLGTETDYINAVLADTPKAFWKLQDSSGNPVDSSGNALDFTSSSGSPTYSNAGPDPGAFTKSVGIAAASGFSRAQISGVTDNLTFEFWLNFSSISANHSIVGNNNGGLNGYEIVSTSASKLAMVCQNVGFCSDINASLSTSNWYHIVMLRSSGTWKYYINGLLDNGSATSTNPLAPSGATTTIDRDLGGNVFKIAYFAFYESALSATRVAAHYNTLNSIGRYYQ